jgi:hypothetical protein
MWSQRSAAGRWCHVASQSWTRLLFCVLLCLVANCGVTVIATGDLDGDGDSGGDGSDDSSSTSPIHCEVVTGADDGGNVTDGTFRWCITRTNAAGQPADPINDPHRITFDKVPKSEEDEEGKVVITVVGSGLPFLQTTVVVDGGWRVVVDGSSLTVGAWGLNVRANHTAILGMTVRGFSGEVIYSKTS